MIIVKQEKTLKKAIIGQTGKTGKQRSIKRVKINVEKTPVVSTTVSDGMWLSAKKELVFLKDKLYHFHPQSKWYRKYGKAIEERISVLQKFLYQ